MLGISQSYISRLEKELLKGCEKNSTKWFNFFMKFEVLTAKGFRLDLLIFGN